MEKRYYLRNIFEVSTDCVFKFSLEVVVKSENVNKSIE